MTRPTPLLSLVPISLHTFLTCLVDLVNRGQPECAWPPASYELVMTMRRGVERSLPLWPASLSTPLHAYPKNCDVRHTWHVKGTRSYLSVWALRVPASCGSLHPPHRYRLWLCPCPFPVFCAAVPRIRPLPERCRPWTRWVAGHLVVGVAQERWQSRGLSGVTSRYTYMSEPKWIISFPSQGRQCRGLNKKSATSAVATGHKKAGVLNQ